MATAVAQLALAALFERAPAGPRNGKKDRDRVRR